MADFLVPAVIGFFAAISVVMVIKMLRRRNAHSHPPAPEVPQSRQHRRAIERRVSKKVEKAGSRTLSYFLPDRRYGQDWKVLALGPCPAEFCFRQHYIRDINRQKTLEITQGLHRMKNAPIPSAS